MGKEKNKAEKSGKFFETEKRPSTHHNPPPNDHNFTTKTPPKKHTLPKTPLKNTRKDAGFPTRHHANLFF
jgi:hypothetical protein